jgi:hypothetical protein
MRKPVAPVTKGMAKQKGAVIRRTIPRPRRGPIRSQTVPISTRATIVPVTAARPALASWGLVRFKSSRMIGIIGAAAKVDTNDTKKPIHDR